MKYPELMISWLQTLLGKRLISINALFHVLASEKDSSPKEVSFIFDDAEVGKIYGGSDGATLCFSFKPLCSCDLGEYGMEDIFCISDEPLFSDVVGSRLASVKLLKSLTEEAVIGLFLSFDNKSNLCILNLGDELFVYDHLPESIVTDEQLSLISVR
ncbi:hypothetical protein [Pseudomonas syringae]|uniref:Uncharacterized protein n=2 Tax=Pseudomonas syringae TaxID=317 RepID=A0A9Q4FKK3_PSESX|nr:hypothetical protein [Pseudomonas syringae]MCF5471052.1 hypothetical protein [Pseudomonas syringae]MCF5475984.1 hypothetical protein [Pseudomonas syringae]MCF5486004.1 hypothetical protein [Pseudomonas syringae]MCF5495905.1 hypothetical protein [Pseudomonas syringae]MCF5500589.1 hypothetical protein [Pseudomonas syringae]